MNTLIFTPAWQRVAAWKVLQIMNIICCVCRPIPVSIQGCSTFPPIHHKNFVFVYECVLCPGSGAGGH